MAPGEGRDRTDPQPGPLPGQPRAPPRERLHPQARPPPHPGLPGHSRGKYGQKNAYRIEALYSEKKTCSRQ